MMDTFPGWIPRRLLTVEEVAALLNLSTRQVRRMIAADRLQATRLGRAVRIRPEVLAVLLQQKVTV
jgi:excisionase family DNA binding protein